MALKPSSSGAVWHEAPGSGAALVALEAGYVQDAFGWIPTTTKPFTGAVLDIAGAGNYVLTDVSAGYPAYVSELKLASVGGHFITYF
jgi:hypothetical protein